MFVYCTFEIALSLLLCIFILFEYKAIMVLGMHSKFMLLKSS